MPSGLRVGRCGFPVSLRRYAEEFSAVEVQQTFYKPPALRTLEKWRSAVPAGFEFTYHNAPDSDYNHPES